MSNSRRYDPEQWQLMNSPEGQARIRHGLYGYLHSFLDTAPEGGSLGRAKGLLALVKQYFETELNEAEASPADIERVERMGAAEHVLAALTATIERIPTDERYRTDFDGILASPPPTDAEREAHKKEWGAMEELFKKEGMKGWWD